MSCCQECDWLEDEVDEYDFYVKQMNQKSREELLRLIFGETPMLRNNSVFNTKNPRR